MQLHMQARLPGLQPDRIWSWCRYELAWLEHQGRIKRGNRIWQLVFGSGFKCNSAVSMAPCACPVLCACSVRRAFSAGVRLASLQQPV